MIYKKISNTQFLLTENDELVNKANSIVSEISNGDIDAFESSLNEILFDSILSRLVVSDFFKQGNKIPNELNFITIKTSVNGRALIFSVGEVHAEETVKKLD